MEYFSLIVHCCSTNVNVYLFAVSLSKWGFGKCRKWCQRGNLDTQADIVNIVELEIVTIIPP